MKLIPGKVLFFALAAVLLIGSAASAQTSADESDITKRLAAYADARTKRDAHAEALCYAEDGDFRSSAGPFVTGRAQIEKQLTVNNPNYRFELEIVSMRFLDPQVVIVEADVRAGVGDALGKLVGSYVLVKRNGEWLIGAARIARAMP